MSASLTTKGLVAGSGALSPEAVLGAPAPPPLALPGTDALHQVMVVIPTAINVVLMVSENITANLRVRQPASFALPSLYKRAYLIAYETDEVAIVRP